MEILLILCLLGLAVALFVSEKLPPAATALLVLGSLVTLGEAGPRLGWLDAGKWINTADALSGFSSPAVIAVGCLYVLSAALQKAGFVELAASWLEARARSPRSLLLAAMGLSAFVSGFINNTATVAALLPAVMAVCHRRGWAPSRFLMPLSFAAQFGGLCTLVGTSTTLLVNSLAIEAGHRGFGFFEPAPIGLAFCAVGGAYFVFWGGRLLPDRAAGAGPGDDSVWEPGDFVTEVLVQREAPIIGKTVAEAGFSSGGPQVLEIIRGGQRLLPPGVPLQPDDVLLLRAPAAEVEKIRGKLGLTLNAEHELRRDDLEQGELVMAQVLVSPGSVLEGRTLAQVRFHDRYEAIILGIQRTSSRVRRQLSQWRLRGGDMLLILTTRRQLAALRDDTAFIVLREREPGGPSGWRRWAAGGIFGSVVLAAFSGVPVSIAALAGTALCVGTGALRLEQAVAAVNWQVILLLACLLPLGAALEKSGAAAVLAGALIHSAGALGPVALLALLYLLTAVLTEFMSNNAAAVLLTPVALTCAATLGVDPRPLLIAVTCAASTSFATPVGYQTNTMIYGPGRYRFSDFLRVGIPLNILFWLVAVLLIPLIWPL